MEAKGTIELSSEAWLSPIVQVSKTDRSKRMCLDYRKINHQLAIDIYPLPRLDKLVGNATGNKFYATIDMKDAYQGHAR